MVGSFKRTLVVEADTKSVNYGSRDVERFGASVDRVVDRSKRLKGALSPSDMESFAATMRTAAQELRAMQSAAIASSAADAKRVLGEQRAA